MKKIIVAGLFMFLLIPTQQVLADEDHVKPTDGILTKEEISAKKEALQKIQTGLDKKDLQSNQSNQETDQSKELKKPVSDKRLASMSDPVILDMNWVYGEIIAAAVARDPDNVADKTTYYSTVYEYYYNSRGNLDYVTEDDVRIAEVEYCDGTEAYNCPLDWVNWINFDPIGEGEYLDFYYTYDNPSTDYYASFPGEPDIYFFNINMADGMEVTSSSDPLYDDDLGTRISIDIDQVTGFEEGDPWDPNWTLWFDNFTNQRLTKIANADSSMQAFFYPSVSRSIYRFWSNTKQHHFFTMSKAEKNQVVNLYDDNVWNLEGISSKGYPTQEANTTAVYRFWSDSKQGHFFTASGTEKDHIIATWPDIWHYEGIAYYTYATSQPDSTAVYRFWSDSKQGHFFTSSEGEKNHIIATWPDIWNYEGIAWYVPTDTIYYIPED